MDQWMSFNIVSFISHPSNFNPEEGGSMFLQNVGNKTYSQQMQNYHYKALTSALRKTAFNRLAYLSCQTFMLY